MLIVNPEDAHTARLVAELQRKLADPAHLGQVMSAPGMSRLLAGGALHRAQQAGKTIGLSFELKVLEICLEMVGGAGCAWVVACCGRQLHAPCTAARGRQPAAGCAPAKGRAVPGGALAKHRRAARLQGPPRLAP